MKKNIKERRGEEEEKEGGRKKNGDEPLKAQVVDAPLITVGFD